MFPFQLYRVCVLLYSAATVTVVVLPCGIAILESGFPVSFQNSRKVSSHQVHSCWYSPAGNLGAIRACCSKYGHRRLHHHIISSLALCLEKCRCCLLCTCVSHQHPDGHWDRNAVSCSMDNTKSELLEILLFVLTFFLFSCFHIILSTKFSSGEKSQENTSFLGQRKRK